MYDKYLTANKITVNTKIPKHKGILVSANASANIPLSLYVGDGSTLSAGLTFNSGVTIFNMQVYSITSFPAGTTGFYLN